MPPIFPATVRLYRTQSYARTFSSRVLDVTPCDAGIEVILHETLFYARAGGQPSDSGTLTGDFGHADLIKATNRGDHIIHLISLTEGRTPKTGDTVHGTLNWEMRHRNMQRHSAQHLLSQACLRLCSELNTVSVGISSPYCTVDVEGELSGTDLNKIEQIVNRVVYANLPIFCFEVDEQQISHYPVRRPPAVTGRIRLVQVGPDDDIWEMAACGGTHVSSTCEVAPIKVLKLERIRHHLNRITFCCGLDALDDYGLKHEVGTAIAQSFSSQVGQLPARIEALRESLHQAKGEQMHLASQLAQRLLEAHGQAPFIHIALTEAEQACIKPLTELVAKRPDGVVLISLEQGSTHDGRVRLTMVRGTQATAADMRTLLKAALPHIKGRGGGKPEVAQGTGEAKGLAQAVEAVGTHLTSQHT